MWTSPCSITPALSPLSPSLPPIPVIATRTGLLFFVSINQTVGAIFSVLQTFSAEIRVLRREHDANAYSVAAYFFSKVVAEVCAMPMCGGAFWRALCMGVDVGG